MNCSSSVSRLRVAVVAIAILSSIGPLSAAIIGISIVPVEILIGNAAICSPNEFNNTDPISTTTWSQRKHYPDLTTAWEALGTSSTQQVIGQYPITYEFRLETTYGSVPGMPMPHPPTTHYMSRTVFPADGVRDFSNFDVEFGMGQIIPLKYQIRRGNQDAGPYIGGLAQERLTNRFQAGVGDLPDVDWWPHSPGPTFQMVGGQIWDEHYAPVWYWNNIPTPGVIATAVQELRIEWTDPFNGVHHQNLGSQQIVHRKATSSTWKVTH